MSDTSTVDTAAQLAALQAQVAQLLQTQGTNQGGTYPHASVLAGHPAHTITPPMDELGQFLKGAYNRVTGLWEDPDTAAKNQAAADQAKADAVAQQKEAAKADLIAKARAIAEQELADEADLKDLVAQQKQEISSASTSSTASDSGSSGPH